jgi:hypothetical protein
MKRMNTRSHIHSFSCSKVYEHLCVNLDSKLDSKSCEQIKAHIEGCSNCTALLDSLKKTVSLYKRYPSPRLSQQCREKFFAILHQEKTKKHPSH